MDTNFRLQGVIKVILCVAAPRVLGDKLRSLGRVKEGEKEKAVISVRALDLEVVVDEGGVIGNIMVEVEWKSLGRQRCVGKEMLLDVWDV